MQQFLPSQRIPGFAFHQSERMDDNGTWPCSMDTDICYDMNARDFDYLGYQFSLLSSIGTAGLNNVLCMIPARDQEEFTLFPEKDLAFISRWLSWTDANKKFLEHTRPISTLPPPTLGSVDGTCALFQNSGFLFLFNPNPTPMAAQLTADESICIDNATLPLQWNVQMLYPQQQALPKLYAGTTFSVNVPGASAVVVQLDLDAEQLSPTAIDVLGAQYSIAKTAVNGNYLDIDIEGLRVSLYFCEFCCIDSFYRRHPMYRQKCPSFCPQNWQHPSSLLLIYCRGSLSMEYCALIYTFSQQMI
jgi:hypothetical protein